MVIKKKKSMREQVYEYLKQEIVNGNIPEESRIVEEEYADKLNVSRTPLREALRMLELEGLVEAREKGGVTISRTTKKDIYEVIKIRQALESLILEEVLEKIKENDLQKLEENINNTEKIIDIDSKAEDVFKYFSEFNKILYGISDLTRVISLINDLNLYLKKFRKLSIKNKKRRKEAHNDHKKIVELIKEKNKIELIKINQKHLEESEKFLINQLEGY